MQFNNGGGVNLKSLTTMPENVQFNNGGYVYLRSKYVLIGKSYLVRFKIPIQKKTIILYKKVSTDYKTQKTTENETLWKILTTVTCKDWHPEKNECGEGKFHGCAYPHWCDIFREGKGKYIAIKVKIRDLYEWQNNPAYPQKIGFREGTVLYECDRYGRQVFCAERGIRQLERLGLDLLPLRLCRSGCDK